MKTYASRTAPRLFAPLDLPLGAEIQLPDRAARHVAVLRLGGGDAITLFDGQGGEFAAELTRVSSKHVRVRVVSKLSLERESPLRILLAQCISSGDRMDTTMQKSTELGVSSIVPVASERSVVRLSGDRAQKRVAHWRNVVIAACEQCGRNRIPEVLEIAQLSDLLGSAERDGLRLLLAPDGERKLAGLKPPSGVTLLVGPEGGLTASERQSAERAGFIPVRFGPRVLRTETAPLAAIAAMQTLWGDC